MKSAKIIAALLAVVLGAAGTVSAAEVQYDWVGGASGSWTDPNNWECPEGKGVDYPGGIRATSEDQVACFFYSSANQTVEVSVDSDVTFYRLRLPTKSTQSTATEVSTVRISGTGKLTMTSPSDKNTETTAGFGLSKLRQLVVDGNPVSVGCMCMNGGRLDVDNGSICEYASARCTNGGSLRVGADAQVISTASCSAYVRDGSTVLLDGGEFYSAFYVTQPNYEPGYLTVNDGLLRLRFLAANALSSNVVFNGGTVRLEVKTNLVDSTLLDVFAPMKAGTTFALTNKLTGTVAAKTEYIDFFGTRDATDGVTEGDFPFAGTFRGEGANPTVFVMNCMKGTVGDGGSLVLPSLQFGGEESVVDLNLSSVVLRDGITLKSEGTTVNVRDGLAFGAYDDDWSVPKKKNVAFNLYGTVTVDTTDWLDGTTPRTISLSNLCYGKERASLVVKGKGVANLTFTDTAKSCFREVIVEDGATLVIDNQGSYQLRTDLLKLGKGSTLLFAAGAKSFDAVESEIDETAVIRIVAPSSLAAARTVLGFNAGVLTGSLAGVQLVNEGTVNWAIGTSGTTVYLTDGSAATAPATPASGRSVWTGAVDGNWTKEGNWLPAGGAPGPDENLKSNYVDFYDSPDWNVVNDFTGSKFLVRLLTFCEDPSGPYVLSGNQIKISVGNSIADQSPFPITISAPVARSSTYFHVTATRGGSLAFTGGATTPTDIMTRGDIRFGGTSTCWSLTAWPVDDGTKTYGGGRPNKITVLPGGTLTASAQTSNFTYAVSLNVRKNATLRFAPTGTGTGFTDDAGACNHVVDGLLDIAVPYFAACDQTFWGAGRVNVASTLAVDGHSSRTILAGGVKLVPSAWNTATAGAADDIIAITVEDAATLGATADWTYGVASGVTATSAAADRALRIAKRATLTIDTDDADGAGTAHALTFTDPILGATGNLVLKGSGTVAVAADSTVATLKVASGAPALVAANGATLTVADSADLDGLVVRTDSAEWQDVAVFGSDCTVSGTATAADGCRVRRCGTRLQAKVKAGLLFIFR